ncbi:D-amino acid dehydrogenase [Sedimenticola selenatireducens]|uniref:D-amino acid dehydrogenase n=1 Tax=Sedimenticola selenatireducens TaxID=191960 RepID=A0A557RZ69_9GAMM|nr:D-amino acid dehydrogenase [Sedimenticola selenatireducens]TVO70450.1 D-amino acid dehydrogenase [Sedimenticola selenatireducens]TVT63027.1 MAG: D-amino acid dehydrogenase [Sedimenticola selenatireducens]
MKVVILGSGVIGVTNAYYLAREGHEVTVIDRQPEPALETSFANAGEVSPGYSAPWAAPGIPLKAIKWLMMKHSPLVIKPSLDLSMWAWSLQMLRNCTPARYETNKGRMVRLAEYSRDAIKALRSEIGIQYDERSRGTLQMFRNQKQLDAAATDMAILDRFGVPYELLDREGCINAEPGLIHVKEKVAGGLRLINDETGDCFMFTQTLAKAAEAMGVEFRMGVNIRRLITDQGNISGVETDQGVITGDAYVMALGSYSPLLLKAVGIKAPIYPVKGYSITLPVVDSDAAPVSTIMDETHKVAITRLGDRIRVAGTAELAGYNTDLNESRRETVEFVVSDLFPKGGDISKTEFWCGLRPMTPDGTPCVGATKIPNLYLNTGHGTLGWTMACGSGRLLSDLISNKQPEIDTEGLSIDRYAA